MIIIIVYSYFKLLAIIKLYHTLMLLRYYYSNLRRTKNTVCTDWKKSHFHL